MPKNLSLYVCTACDAQSAKWQGRCTECGAWGSLVPTERSSSTSSKEAEVVLLSSAKQANLNRLKTEVKEIDRVFGGGLVVGSLTLLAGEPGIGKSTLVAQIANNLSKNHKIIYVSGEESLGQIRMRLERLNCDLSKFNCITDTDIEAVAKAIEKNHPSLVIIDSIQTVHSPLIPQEAGSLNQIRAAASRCLETAKKNDIAMILIGHITKDGNLAGPKSLEHLVDTVLYLEQENSGGYQVLRAAKNRFGSTDEIGLLEMTGLGFKEVTNPTAISLKDENLKISGSAVGCIIEGSRPFLVEIQALVTKTVFGYPQRKTSGFDLNRLQVLAAVINKRTKFNLSNQDIILNVVGGFKTTDPALDAAVCAAVISSFLDRPLPTGRLIMGEVGLGGEIRAIPQTTLRLKEGLKLGFSEAALPRPEKSVKIEQKQIKKLEDLNALFS